MVKEMIYTFYEMNLLRRMLLLGSAILLGLGFALMRMMSLAPTTSKTAVVFTSAVLGIGMAMSMPVIYNESKVGLRLWVLLLIFSMIMHQCGVLIDS